MKDILGNPNEPLLTDHLLDDLIDELDHSRNNNNNNNLFVDLQHNQLSLETNYENFVPDLIQEINQQKSMLLWFIIHSFHFIMSI